MPAPLSRHRLRSSAFIRPDDHFKIEPKKVVFLSVEGDETERAYFEYLNEHVDNSIIKIEVLRHRRGDGYSDPIHVIDLLTEYISVRAGELVPEPLFDQLSSHFSKEELQSYIDNESSSLPPNRQKEIKESLLLIGIDLDYRRYLQTYGNESDYFAVVLDRDAGNHSREVMEQCIARCNEHNYGCFVSNPCFEFWLLLHLCDVQNAYSEHDLNEFLQNQKISARHTRVSAELNKLAKHGKTLGPKKFEEFYLPNIQNAIKNAQAFVNDFPELLDCLGTNIPKLFSLIQCKICKQTDNSSVSSGD